MVSLGFLLLHGVVDTIDAMAVVTELCCLDVCLCSSRQEIHANHDNLFLLFLIQVAFCSGRETVQAESNLGLPEPDPASEVHSVREIAQAESHLGLPEPDPASGVHSVSTNIQAERDRWLPEPDPASEVHGSSVNVIDEKADCLLPKEMMNKGCGAAGPLPTHGVLTTHFWKVV